MESANTLSGPSAGAVVGVVVAVLILLLIVVDVSCYFVNGCGALASVCSQVSGHSPASKEKMIEEGDRLKSTAHIGYI